MLYVKIVYVKCDFFDVVISNFKMLFDCGYEYLYDFVDIVYFIVVYEVFM